MPQNKVKKRHSETGNVFVLILLGVFLFGALMYAFSRNAQQGTGNLTKQQAKIAAQEILNYARLVEGAVDRVRRNGCSETEISFDNAVVSGYSNPNAPGDNSCHIFEDEGGKMSYMEPQENWSDSTHSAQATYNKFSFTDYTAVQGIGTVEEEGVFLLNFINKDLCIEINNQLNITNPSDLPPEDVGTMNYDTLYDGKFLPTVPSPINATEVIKKPTGCVQRNGVNQYHFYHVLLAR